MIYNRITLFLALLFNFGLLSCVNNQDNMKKYDWLPTTCAPKFYPAEIFQSYFILEDQEELNIPGDRSMYNGWGNLGPTHIVGEPLKSIPTKLNIIWMSYTENKFYEGTFDLSKEKISALFQEGYVDRLGRKKTFNKINIGVAPGGTIIIWVMGAGWSIEIDRFQAKETEVSMKEFKPYAIIDRAQYVSSILESLPDNIKEGLKSTDNSFNPWKETYRNKYAWSPKLNFTNEGNLTEILAEFYNGEKFFVEHTNPILNKFEDRALPRHMRLEWSDKNENKYGAKIYFDEIEIFQAFETIYKNPKTNQAELIIEIDKYNSNLSLSLKSESESIPLTKARIKVFATTN